MKIAALAALAALLATPALAQSQRIVVDGPAGTTTIDRSASGPAGDRSGGATIVGPRGGVWDRQFQRRYDPATGIYTRDRSLTGPAGRTRSFQGQTRRVGPGEWENRRTFTGPRGNALTRDRWIRIQRR